MRICLPVAGRAACAAAVGRSDDDAFGPAGFAPEGLTPDARPDGAEVGGTAAAPGAVRSAGGTAPVTPSSGAGPDGATPGPGGATPGAGGAARGAPVAAGSTPAAGPVPGSP